MAKVKKDPIEKGLQLGIPPATGTPYGGLPILWIDNDVFGSTAFRGPSGEAQSIVINGGAGQSKLRLHTTLLHEFVHVAEQRGIYEGVFKKDFTEEQVDYLAEFLLGLLATAGLYKPISPTEFMKLAKAPRLLKKEKRREKIRLR